MQPSSTKPQTVTTQPYNSTKNPTPTSNKYQECSYKPEKLNNSSNTSKAKKIKNYTLGSDSTANQSAISNKQPNIINKDNLHQI